MLKIQDLVEVNVALTGFRYNRPQIPNPDALNPDTWGTA
jgi:hypothetical protein